MIRGLFNAATNLNFQQLRMEIITNNNSNLATSGFKQDSLIAKPFQEVMLQEKQMDNIAGRGLSRWSPIGSTNLGVDVSRMATDYSTGILKKTDNYSDLAINGKGFFTVQSKEGRVLYSRDGQFSVDEAGWLVDMQGSRLLSDNGPIQAGKEKFTVNDRGELSLADGSTVQLKIVEFNDPHRLVKEGNVYFSAPGGGEFDALNPEIAQGYLEMSNVDFATQMVNMVEVLRAYETGQKLIQVHDELLGIAINQVGTVK